MEVTHTTLLYSYVTVATAGSPARNLFWLLMGVVLYVFFFARDMVIRVIFVFGYCPYFCFLRHSSLLEVARGDRTSFGKMGRGPFGGYLRFTTGGSR